MFGVSNKAHTIKSVVFFLISSDDILFCEKNGKRMNENLFFSKLQFK